MGSKTEVLEAEREEWYDDFGESTGRGDAREAIKGDGGSV